MPEGWEAFLVFAPIAFAGAILYGLSGFGSALVTVPLAAQFFPLPFVIASFALVDLSGALRLGLENPRNAVRGEVARMAPMIIVGLALGVGALVNLPRRASMLALGAFILAYALYSLARRASHGVVSRRWAYVAGMAGGITGTLFGAGGPPYAIYLAHRALTKEQFRATLTMTSIFSISLRVIAFLVTGLLSDPRVWIAAACAIPATLAGIAVASRIFHRVSREAVMRVVALTLLAAGVTLVVRAAG
ncbi:MAG: sulfite exporter TauE/SafE family protein [Burkholderiales bacterium]